MPRKGPAPRREVTPDPVHHSVLVTQVINKVLLDGKRSVAERIVYDAINAAAEKAQTDPLSVLKKAVDNIKPAVEVKSRRVGGATYQVPIEVKPRRANTLAIRWMVENSRKRREKTMADRLSAEILDANNGVGASVKKRDDLQKTAEGNRAFAHYRW
jgi:small subunit ribosomal protein S7